jgi:hypothetical protein
MKPDRLNTITGYVWLDKITLPFWASWCAIQKWLFYRHLGKGNAKKGKALMYQAVMAHPAYSPIEEAERILEEWV